MIQFVHITDIHLANRPPVSRVDDYNKSLFKKLKWVCKYCEEHGIKRILLTGDLAHSYKLNDELTCKFVELIMRYDLTVYFIYGNHDIQGRNVNYVHKTNFGLLEKYDWFVNVADRPVKFKNCVLAGYNYGDIDECTRFWQYPEISGKVGNRWKILLTHPMIVDEKTLMIDGKVKQVNYKDVETEADVLLCGHYHDGFKKVIRRESLNRTQKIVNPGSLGRVEARVAKKRKYHPRLAHIKVKKKNISVKLVKVPVKPFEEVFDVSGIKEIKAKKKKKEHFARALSDLSKSNLMSDNFVNTIKAILEEPPEELKGVLDEETIELCKEKVREYCE